MHLFRNTITFLLIFIAAVASAQQEDRYLPGWELGINAGVYIYQGDLTPDKIGSLKTITPGLQVNAGKYITNSLLLRTGFTAAFLKGNDRLYAEKQEYRYYRNYHFKSFVAEWHAMALAYIFDNKFYEQKLQPYITGGAGIVFHHTKNSSADTDFSYFPQSDLPMRLAQDEQRNNRRFFITALSGAGMKYNINTSIALTTELLYRFGFNDYIDGFSIATNSTKNDQFYAFNIGILFNFPDHGLNSGMRKKLRCKL